MKKTVKLFITLVIINILIIGVSFLLGMGDLGTLVVSGFCILISVIILIIAFILELNRSYAGKDPKLKAQTRRKALIITVGIIVGSIIIFTVASFMSGYKITQSDKHKNWPYYPEASNKNVVIDTLKGFYVENVKTIPGSKYGMLYFVSDSVSYTDSRSNDVFFGIMDNNCKIRVKYPDYVTVYHDTKRIIIIKNSSGDETKSDSCDVYDAKNLQLTRVKINTIKLPEKLDNYMDNAERPRAEREFIQKYKNDPFIRSLKGVEEFRYYRGDEPDETGYGLFTDDKGNIYTLDSDNYYSFSLLFKGIFYKNPFYNRSTAAKDIRLSDSSIIFENNLNWGFKISYGNPNANGSDGPYFEYNQTWLMYYTMYVGNTSTSFKIQGPEKDKPYSSFYQLSSPFSSRDTLYYASDVRIHKVYLKK